jgi:hypothetical protein
MTSQEKQALLGLLNQGKGLEEVMSMWKQHKGDKPVNVDINQDVVIRNSVVYAKAEVPPYQNARDQQINQSRAEMAAKINLAKAMKSNTLNGVTVKFKQAGGKMYAVARWSPSSANFARSAMQSSLNTARSIRQDMQDREAEMQKLQQQLDQARQQAGSMRTSHDALPW